MNRFIFIAAGVMLLAGGLAGTAAEPGQGGDRSVCLLFNETGFKEKLAQAVTESLAVRGFSVVTGRTGDAASFRAEDFAAVVYMAEYLAFHVPGNQKEYFRASGEAPNIVFVTTSLSQSARNDNPLDAVTCASKEADLPEVAGAVLERLEKILR